jgi:hypothetical protein
VTIITVSTEVFDMVLLINRYYNTMGYTIRKYYSVKLARKVARMEQQTSFENIKEVDQREVFCVDRTELLKWILEKRK